MCCFNEVNLSAILLVYKRITKYNSFIILCLSNVKHRRIGLHPPFMNLCTHNVVAIRILNITHNKSDSPSLDATCTIDKHDIFRVN